MPPIEEAEAYLKLVKEQKLSHAKVAKRIHKGRSYVSQKMRLLDLPDFVKGLLNDRILKEGHARQLLRLKDMLEGTIEDEIRDSDGNLLRFTNFSMVACKFAEDAWLDSLSVNGLKDKIDVWWWSILQAKWELHKYEPDISNALKAKKNGKLYRLEDDTMDKYFVRLWRYGFKDTELSSV